MKRQYKFRARDTKENKWLFGYDYPNLGGFSLIGEVVLMGQLNTISLTKLCEEVEFTQYTGQKDINGKEIYEGDVVQWFITQNPIRHVVIWHHTEYRTIDVSRYHICENNNYNQSGGKPTNETWRKFEVIGNIYDNANLLNDGRAK